MSLVSASATEPSGPAVALIVNSAGGMNVAVSVSACVTLKLHRWLVPVHYGFVPPQFWKWKPLLLLGESPKALSCTGSP